MTCVVAVVENNTVYMGADSAGIAGLSITIRKDSKVFTNGPFILGFTQSFRMGQLLRFKLDPPKQTVSQDDYQYMVTDFIDSVRKCFSVNGFGDKEATTGGNFLVGYKGRLYTIEKDHQVGIPDVNYDALGCGSDLALGSLHTTAKFDFTPEERITMALEAATAFSAGVEPPFLILKQEGEAEPQKSVKKSKKIK